MLDPPFLGNLEAEGRVTAMASALVPAAPPAHERTAGSGTAVGAASPASGCDSEDLGGRPMSGQGDAAGAWAAALTRTQQPNKAQSRGGQTGVRCPPSPRLAR